MAHHEVNRLAAWQGGTTLEVRIPRDEADKFRAYMATPDYLREERSYKQALSDVIKRLLATDQLPSRRFPELLKGVLDEAPDYPNLGFSASDASKNQKMFKASGVPGPRGALTNLAGGRFGLAQFQWISRAIEFGLGEQVQRAFQQLLEPEAPLALRVDQFRDELYAAQLALRDKPDGFLPKWRDFRISLSFIAAVLGAFDPTRYTFYAARPLQRAFGDYGLEWPSGSAGEKYEVICQFLTAIQRALRGAEVPVVDLIDAQSFVWTRGAIEQGSRASAGTTAKARERAEIDVEQVARSLAKATYWDLSRATSLVGLARRRRQLLFQGPPGTGKTFVAQKLTELLSEDQENRVEKVQFHPSYAYEDFVEGIRPKLTADAVGFEIRKGVFLRLVEAAQPLESDNKNEEEQFFLIIDELNRANLPRVLGELLYALEYRGKKNDIKLPYSNKSFYVPTNLTLIATMNTADRSIALVDAAIRRRFAHVNFAPDTKALRGWLIDNGCGPLADRAVDRLDSLNAELRLLLDEDRLIGHTFLMRDLRQVSYKEIWEEDIEPVVREHLFNRPIELARLKESFVDEP